MDPVTTLVTGAVLGVTLQVLYDTIQRVKARSSTIRKRLEVLGRRTMSLRDNFVGINERYPDFELRPEIKKLRGLIMKADDLVRDCDGLGFWHPRLVRECSEQLDDLNASFEDFLKVDLQCAQLSYILDIADHVVKMNNKLSQGWQPVQASDGTPGFIQARPEAVRCTRWHPPSLHSLKCNMDVVFKPDERRWGCGLILRDHAGSFMSSLTFHLTGIPEVREGKAMALLEAMNWVAQGSQVSNVVFEVESAEVVKAVTDGVHDDTEFGRIVSLCRSFLYNHLPRFRVGGITRNGNKVAHELAQQSFSHSSPFFWYPAPTWLEDALSDMCMHPDK